MKRYPFDTNILVFDLNRRKVPHSKTIVRSQTDQKILSHFTAYPNVCNKCRSTTKAQLSYYFTPFIGPRSTII